MLRYAVILAIKNLEENMIPAVIFKSTANYFPCIAFIVVNETFYIFKYKNFGFAFFYNACEFTEKRTSCIFKTFTLSDH